MCLLCVAVMGFRSPGLYYDEAIFFNAAVHVVNSGQEPPFAHDPWSWITLFDRRWPVMVLPYVGPIRSYLAMIPFAIFGANYYTARILTAILGAFAIWGFAVLIRDCIDVKTAALVSLILAIHPAYLAQSIYDNGGVAEWMVPFGLLSIAVARYHRAPSGRSAFWIGAAMGLGVWSRANFAWLVGSAILAGAIVLGRKALLPLRWLAALIGGGVAGAAALLSYEIRSAGATFEFSRVMADPKPLLQLAGYRLYLLSQVLVSDSEHREIWNAPTLPLWQAVIFTTVVATALYVCLRSRTLPELRRMEYGRMAALTFLLLLACMFQSRLNVTEHHLIALVPIAALVVVIAAREVYRRWPNARYAIAAVAVLYVITALQWNLAAAGQIRSTGGVRWWSNAIDPLTSYLERNREGKNIKVLDWGLNNNLFVLSNGRIRSAELFWGATVERSGSGKLWKDELASGDIYVLHAPPLGQSPDAAEGFRRALAASAWTLRRTEFRQKNGAGYAEVVEILAP